MRSRTLKIGGFDHVKAVSIGGGLPPVIQTMWKDRLSFEELSGDALDEARDDAVAALVRRVETLEKMGCGLLRFAVPDLNAAGALGSLASMVSMPLVADIHFDYKIALRCLDFPIAKIRINPGNIGSPDKVRQVLEKASDKGIPIRIGVNAGSLPKDVIKSSRIFSRKGAKDAEEYKNSDSSFAISASQRSLRDEFGNNTIANALVEAAMRELAIFDEFGFKDIIVSMKASSAAETIKANRLFAERSDVPLHVGVTEAGPLIAGVVQNTAALMALLGEGIGDTIRVSLSDTMEKEVIAGQEILAAVREAAGKAREGLKLISCPRCGRSSFDTHGFTARWENRLYSLKKDITVAVMGCAVNGPGEARHADLGISGAGDKALIFRKGKVTRTIDAAEADSAFEEELRKF